MNKTPRTDKCESCVTKGLKDPAVTQSNTRREGASDEM